VKRLALVICGWLIASTSHANIASEDSAYRTGGFGKWIIDSLFEAGSISSQAGSAGIVGATIMPLSLVCMMVAALIIAMKSIQHLLIVAQAKDLDQSPVSMTWAPLHMVIAVVLMVPLPSGYSMGQYGAIWVAHQSNTLGNLTAANTTGFFRNTGVITAPAIPSIKTVADGIILSEMCRYLNNEAGSYVEDNGGVPITVERRAMTIDELSAIGGTSVKYGAENGLSRSGFTFARNRAGGFFGGYSTVDDYCGAVVIQFAARSKATFGDDNVVPLQRQGASNLVSGAAEKCQYGPLCIGGVSVAHQDAKTNAINIFSEAHNGAITAFEADKTKTAAIGIAEGILYDIPLYFESKSSSEAAQEYTESLKEEPARINTAVKASVALIGDLQSDVYSSYTKAINKFGTTRTGNSGSNFLDIVDQVGWPVLGLYWFQYTNFSQQVMDSASVQAIYTGDLKKFMDSFELVLDDPVLAGRIEARITAYRAALANELQNTRYDANPAATKGLSLEDKTLQTSKDMLEIREAFPLMQETMLENSYRGSMNPQNVMDSVTQSINTITRSILFPAIIAPLREDNLVNALVNTGHNIIVISEIIYASNVLIRTYKQRNPVQTGQQEDENKSWIGKAWSFMSNPISSSVGWVADKLFIGFAIDALLIVLNDFAQLWFYVFLMGLFLAFYIPAMIMIQWLIGLVTWIIYIVEATVIIPLWGLLFTADMGQKSFAPQTAQQGFIHILSILVYPSLMTIGFVIGLKVIDLASIFLVEYLLVGLMNSSEGYVYGILSMIAGLLILGLACYQVITRVFSLVLELNDRAMSWIGNRQGYGEGQSEGQVRAGVNAMIGKVEIGKRMGGGPGGGAKPK